MGGPTLSLGGFSFELPGGLDTVGSLETSLRSLSVENSGKVSTVVMSVVPILFGALDGQVSSSTRSVWRTSPWIVILGSPAAAMSNGRISLYEMPDNCPSNDRSTARRLRLLDVRPRPPILIICCLLKC